MVTNASTGYALLAVSHIAKNKEKTLLVSQDISKKCKIPLEYLLKILHQLVRANILRSKRGPRGGFSLARTPKKISMLDIIEAVEGPFVSQLNLIEQAPKIRFSKKAEQAHEKGLEAAKSVLRKANIANLQ